MTTANKSDFKDDASCIEESACGFENLRKKFGRFRILIVGWANAGRTTILRGICDTTENPEAYDGEGNKVWV